LLQPEATAVQRNAAASTASIEAGTSLGNVFITLPGEELEGSVRAPLEQD
jgi:hypothetical protein